MGMGIPNNHSNPARAISASSVSDCFAAGEPRPSSDSGWAKHLPYSYSHTQEVLSAIGRQRSSIPNLTAAQSRLVYASCVAAADPKLERLLKAECLASERYDRLRDYPGDVQEVALALWTEASWNIAQSIRRAL
jgi:hypothetical protein